MPLSVVCFGEILWDVLPHGTFLGGAPLNVAAHLARLGSRSHLVSRIGNDARGFAARQQVAELGVGAYSLQVDDTLPTGEARAAIDSAGSASYAFNTPAAWDAIAAEPAALQQLATADALVFGSLAQRSVVNRETLQQLLAKTSFRVFDVNLRQPHHDPAVVLALLRESDLVKVNEEECVIVGNWLGTDGAPDSLLRAIRALRDPVRGAHAIQLCITRGAQGSLLWADGSWHEQSAVPVKVVDTVGAGDSFLAMLLARRLRGAAATAALAAAANLAAYVASRPGAVPPYNALQFPAGA
jgi:fructokinase